MKHGIRLVLLTLVVFAHWRTTLAQWVQTNGPDTSGITALAGRSDGTGGVKIFAGTFGAGVYLSTDIGTSWNPTNLGLGVPFVTALHFTPDIAGDTVLLAGTEEGIYHSFDDGVHWFGGSLAPGVAVYEFAHYGGNVFAGTTQGVYKLISDAFVWDTVNTGLPGGAVNGIACNDTTVFAATSFGLFSTTNNGAAWLPTQLQGIEITVVCACAGTVFAASHNSFYYSSDDGVNWTAVSLSPFLSLFRLVARTNPAGGFDLFAGTPGDGVVRSTDNGLQWLTDIDPIPTRVVGLEVIGTDLYAGTYGISSHDFVWRRPLPQTFLPVLMTQQGPKLLGSGAVGPAKQGVAVGLCADGSTAIVGGHEDDNHAGAVWVYTRNAVGDWTQQGPKLFGTGAAGSAAQGVSVAISADGNTALWGGSSDNSGAGAAWVFTRTAGSWTQQGPKLVAAGAIGNAFQGSSVSLSGDGNTALIGGGSDNGGAGAAWVFVRTGGVWTQQQKLVGSGAIGNARQGSGVSLSSDGNTAVVGGPADNTQTGATWVFVRSGGVWAERQKLIGSGATGHAAQGNAVSASSDGSTIMVGGPLDNSQTGAVWVFLRNAGVWSQQGPKLTGSDAVGHAFQGVSLLLSGNGNNAVFGGSSDDGQRGAAWLFGRDGAGVWAQQGGKLVGMGMVGNANQGGSVSMSADGTTAIVGGANDNANAGAAWVYYRPPGTFRALISRHGLNKLVFDNQETLDTIALVTNSPFPLFVRDVSVAIDTILHPNDADLEISLLHLGVNDTVAYRVGGGGSNFIGTVFDDSSASPIASGTSPFTGTFSPSRPLNQFDGLDASGRWILKVFDDATGNTGTLEAWSLSIVLTTGSTGVSPRDELPGDFVLDQNYPNPFNPSTTIRYALPSATMVTLGVYNMLGQKVTELVNEQQQAGYHDAIFHGDQFASGVYFYQLRAGAYSAVRKLLLVK